jgi:hypothetical protein
MFTNDSEFHTGVKTYKDRRKKIHQRMKELWDQGKSVREISAILASQTKTRKGNSVDCVRENLRNMGVKFNWTRRKSRRSQKAHKKAK